MLGTDDSTSADLKEVIRMSRIGRSAVTGRFTTVKTAVSKPNTHVVETVKKPKGK